ncbi:MAG TPA: hypothetical protein DEF45_05335 [Rhodopirellula sp.]|nr:hypothetical protein [Rhodopirellula sp.]
MACQHAAFWTTITVFWTAFTIGTRLQNTHSQVVKRNRVFGSNTSTRNGCRRHFETFHNGGTLDKTENEESIFRRAIKLKSLAARTAFINEVCGEDTAQTKRMLKLLTADATDWSQFDNFLNEHTTQDIAQSTKPTAENYQIGEEIGRGSTAIVFSAEQLKPFSRTVALKIIRTNHLAPETRQRFRLEQDTLAKLNHANIATIYHAGLTDEGNPYVAMELVKGLPITTYCRRHKLNIKERLKLFVSLCDGIEYAHHSGIIHRDLKPANILVSETLQGPRLKVIDFGIAKQLLSFDDAVELTQESQIMGTLHYMSPEQAAGASSKVSFPSDIFALGVILHELLIDQIPLAAEFKAASTLEEHLKCIRNTVPKPVSDTFFALPDAVEIARKRGTTADSLRDEITPELDHIVSRMLEKQDSRRYPNVTAVKDDLGDYLAGMPTAGSQSRNKFTLERMRYAAAIMSTACLLATVTASLFGNSHLSAEAGKTQRPSRLAKSKKLDSEASVDHGERSKLPELKPRAGDIPPIPLVTSHSPLTGEKQTDPQITPDSPLSIQLLESAASLEMEFKPIQPGTFTGWLGNKPTEITLTRPFSLGVYEVTQDQYERLMGINPSRFKGANKPVTNVSWFDAFEFCRKLSALPAEKAAGNIYRLPTAAEWEYACRAGTKTDYSFGDAHSDLATYAWYKSNSNATTHLVGSKQANSWGLYDMHGNASEWTRDWHESSVWRVHYIGSAVSDPSGPVFGHGRVVRGGSIFFQAEHCRSAIEVMGVPSKRFDDGGFRVALTAGPLKLPESADALGMKFKQLPAGTFNMGHGDTQHEVTFSKPINMGVHEVTQQQYQRIMGYNPSIFNAKDNPVDNVSWEDAVEFCQRLSALTAEQTAGNVYRLPTEAEWEYACRAGTTTAYSFGDDLTQLDNYAWYRKNSGGTSHPVGSKQPNDWGLHDLHGNLWEWCQNYTGPYTSSAITDPAGPPTGSSRVIRGGSWGRLPISCQSAHRGRLDPSVFNQYLGFRVCLTTSE